MYVVKSLKNKGKIKIFGCESIFWGFAALLSGQKLGVDCIFKDNSNNY